MKKNFYLLSLLAVLLFSCQTSQPLKIDKMEGYFPNNTIVYNGASKHLVLTGQAGFERYFGMAKTMNNTVTPIDFDKNNVVAILTKPNKTMEKIEVLSSMLKNDVLEVDYQVVGDGEEQHFTSSDVLLFKIPTDITAVDFATEGKTERITVH